MRVTRNYLNAIMAANKNSGSRSHMANRLQSTSKSRFLSTQAANKTSSTTIYQNMKNSAGEVQYSASKLTDTGANSIFAKAEESGDKTEVTNQIKEFVNQYNTMVRNMKSSGGRLDNSYLNQLNSYASMYRNALQETGVTKQADGTLSVNETTLKKTSLEQLKKTWGSSNSFAANAGSVAVNVQANAVSNLNSQIGSAYSNLLRNFGTSGNFFNFFM